MVNLAWSHNAGSAPRLEGIKKMLVIVSSFSAAPDEEEARDILARYRPRPQELPTVPPELTSELLHCLSTLPTRDSSPK